MTKRLFAYIGLTMLIAFTVVFYLGFYGSVFALGFSICLFILALLVKACRKNRSVLILISVVIFLSTAYFNIYNSNYENKVKKYDGKTVRVSATIKDTHTSRDNFYYELSSDEIGSQNQNYRILLRSSTDLGAEYGDKLTCRVVLSKMESNYYKSKKFDSNAHFENYISKYTVYSTKEKGVGYLPVYIKDKLTYAVSVLIPGYGGELCNSIALGDRYGLSPELYNEFQKTGLSYIIVVSGMHMSIIAFYILLFFRPLKKRRVATVISNTFVIFTVFLYILITGCSPSAIRSGIMIIFVFLGGYFKYKSDTFNNMGFAALFLTVLNPFAVGDIGMLMSFSSVAGILILNPKFISIYYRIFSKRIKNLNTLNSLSAHKREKLRIKIELTLINTLKSIYELFTISACAVIAISPLTLMFFGVCNPFVIIYSAFVSPFISFLMFFSLVTAILWYIPILRFFSTATALIANLIASLVITIVDFTAHIPFLSFYAEPLYMQIWFAVTLIAISVALLFKNRRKSIAIALFVCVIIFAFNYTANLFLNSDKTELKVMSAGDGTTVVLKTPDDVDVISCGGDYLYSDEIFRKLHTIAEKVNLLVVPSANEKSEVNFASEILNEFDVEKVLLYYRYNTNENTYRLARDCKIYRELLEDESLNVKLSGDIVDYIVNVDNHTWQYITDGQISVMIAPHNGKVSEVPKKFINPDYLILNDNIKDINKINYGEIIWTSDKGVPSNYRNVSTVLNDDFSVEFY